MWIWIILLILISAYNAFFSFLPDSIKAKKTIKVISIIVACFTFCYGIVQAVSQYNKTSYAYVTSEGEILKERNFSWEITKDSSEKENAVFIIEDLYTSSNRIKIKPDQKSKVDIYNCIAGVCLKFHSDPARVPNFKVRISF
ncbi:hypothetical protein JW935_07140 [candidate division KSB1 bacterium]|nr:hypothetical protein [candidate division KSB1 bacterium]